MADSDKGFADIMNITVISSLFVLILSFCYGQGERALDRHFNRFIDSLDNVRCVSLNSVKPQGRAFLIKIQNQNQFDRINEFIRAAIEDGWTNIIVRISRGTFHYHENHINLNGLKDSNVSITIKGNKTTVTSEKTVSNEGYTMNPWCVLYEADSLIEVIDKREKLCLAPCKGLIENGCESFYEKVQITQWFKAPVYKVAKIDTMGVYFIAPDLVYLNQFGRKGYNVNYDYMYSDNAPRFRLYDKRNDPQSTASCFLSINDSVLRSFRMEGIRFKGNKSGFALVSIKSLISLQVVLRKCEFDFIRSKVAAFISTANVLFDDNKLTNTTGNELSFIDGCKNVRVTNNIFENCGTGLGNTICVRCNESEYYIANNSFCDFGYCAIGVGLWYGHEKKYDTRGIIEHNEIYFSSQYLAHKDQHTLMDAGAVYVWTQNEDAIIRYNFIHDYGGMKFYSGIYCDDGASNCKIYGNVILNTPDGCSITSRLVKDLKPTFKNNANNFMAVNVVDGPVVFVGYESEERHCMKGANYVIRGKIKDEDKFENLEVYHPDIEVKMTSLRSIRSKYIKNLKIR